MRKESEGRGRGKVKQWRNCKTTNDTFLFLIFCSSLWKNLPHDALTVDSIHSLSHVSVPMSP